jgi:hypothetical protein
MSSRVCEQMRPRGFNLHLGRQGYATTHLFRSDGQCGLTEFMDYAEVLKQNRTGSLMLHFIFVPIPFHSVASGFNL